LQYRARGVAVSDCKNHARSCSCRADPQAAQALSDEDAEAAAAAASPAPAPAEAEEYGGDMCEGCDGAISIETVPQKKAKGYYRDLQYMNMLCGGQPTIRSFKYTHGKKLFVLRGWQFSNHEINGALIDKTIKPLALSQTWGQYKAIKATAGALCAACWTKKCEAAGLTKK
jgi:hypothetical protein